MPKKKNIAIIGAGLGGSLMAIFLAKRGHQVSLYERRPDMRFEKVERGRSINMTLAARGVKALEAAGVADLIMPTTIPLKGRMIHGVNGALSFQPYGKDPHEVIYAVQRERLNSALINFAESQHRVKCHFSRRCLGINKESGLIQLEDERSREQFSVEADLIVGADGTYSTVLQDMQRGERADYYKKYLDWGYKELTIPPNPNGGMPLEKHALHVWPRCECMLMAIPNNDESLTATFTLPFDGTPSFSSLETDADLLAFFESRFRDALSLMPEIVGNYRQNPVAQFYTTGTSQWYYKDRIVLLGDACHTVAPFYGQGMNAAFEDCLTLDACLGKYGDDLEGAFAEYQHIRKCNTDALADLSMQNFIELRDKVKSSFFVARKKVDIMFYRLFPKACVPIYSLISHTTMPYAEAVERIKRRNRLQKFLGIDLLRSLLAAIFAFNNLFKRLFNLAEQPAETPSDQSSLRFIPFRRLLNYTVLRKTSRAKGGDGRP
ncbi:MAG TPA: NAD(P)/FAD-dependent oxidoreductase [Blastocatellia bacterium]|nr:NAD(P)/FAD-dependent oxidoreductase [Blastocatellia bacterium]